jgi:hypothetical protein
MSDSELVSLRFCIQSSGSKRCFDHDLRAIHSFIASIPDEGAYSFPGMVDDVSGQFMDSNGRTTFPVLPNSSFIEILTFATFPDTFVPDHTDFLPGTFALSFTDILPDSLSNGHTNSLRDTFALSFTDILPDSLSNGHTGLLRDTFAPSSTDIVPDAVASRPVLFMSSEMKVESDMRVSGLIFGVPAPRIFQVFSYFEGFSRVPPTSRLVFSTDTYGSRSHTRISIGQFSPKFFGKRRKRRIAIIFRTLATTFKDFDVEVGFADVETETEGNDRSAQQRLLVTPTTYT